jgi:hypothetical protein
VGQEASIKNIFWKCEDDVMVIECTDSRIYVWQVNTGHLDRVEGDAGTIDDILEEFDWGIGICESGLAMQKTISIDRRSDDCFVVLLNLKRLIGEVCDGRLKDEEMRERNASIISNATDASSVSAESVSRQNHLRKVSTLDSNERLSRKSSERAASVSPERKKAGSSIDSRVLCGVLSALLTWSDLSDSIKEAFSERVGLHPCAGHVTIGMLGIDGMGSIPSPCKADEERCEWSVSSTATASRLVQIMSLAKAFLESKGIFILLIYKDSMTRVQLLFLDIPQSCENSLVILQHISSPHSNS